MPSPNTSKETEDLINSLKSNLVIWEDLISKSLKFHNSIKLMTQTSSDLLDSLHSVCDIASKSSCCMKSTGINLTKLVLRQKKIEQKVTSLNNHLNDNLNLELDKFLIEWRKTSLNLKRERDHDWKKANLEYQKSLAEVDRTEKKLRKKNAGKVGLSETASLQIEYANQDAQNKRRYVEELERSAMRRAAVEERTRFKQFLMLLKPILDCQLSMREDLDNLEEVVSTLYGEKSENLDELPEELEQNIQEHTIDNRSAAMPRSYSTLSKQKSVASNGSHSSLNSGTMSTASSEWNNNNVLINACMEMSSRLNENMSHISHDSGIKSDKSLSAMCDNNSNQDESVNYNWDRTLTHVIHESPINTAQQQNESDTECSSSEDENDASTDHNSQDGIIDNVNDVFPLPEQQSHDNEVQFELPLDYPDNLPPPPTTSQQSAVIPIITSISHYQQPVTVPNDNLYPNQSIPPPVYSNLQELKLNAAKKFGANTLSRISFKERTNVLQAFNDCPDTTTDEASTSFLGNAEKDKPLIPKKGGSNTKIATSIPQEVFNRIPQSQPLPPNNDEITSTFGFYNDQDNTTNPTKIPMKGDSIKPSMIRRGSFTTEMQVPQTPKNFNTNRRPSTQERVPLNMYSNKNRGRSMSVTREGESDQNVPEKASEDFNTIREMLLRNNNNNNIKDVFRGEHGTNVESRQRIVNRINGEIKPPTFPKPELPKKQSTSPNNYMAYEYPNTLVNTLTSPITMRSNRFFNDRMMRQNISNSSTGSNLQMKYQQPRMGQDNDHDVDSAAGEEPANDDFNISSNHEMQSMLIDNRNKDDKFKHQLIQMLHASKSQEAARNSSQVPVIQQNQNLSSFYHNNPNNNHKSRTKSTIQNSKYCY